MHSPFVSKPYVISSGFRHAPGLRHPDAGKAGVLASGPFNLTVQGQGVGKVGSGGWLGE